MIYNTYEELKPFATEPSAHLLARFIIPMRNWNILWSPTKKMPVSIYNTYEELKLKMQLNFLRLFVDL